MAVLNEQDRFDVWADLMRQNVGEIKLTKQELRAAVNAIDDFFDANAVTINNALPAVAKANLTTPQKAILLQFVVSKRYLSGA